MTTPAELFTGLLREDAAAPRITCYDDLPGPTLGERIELSGRVLGNWVSKAANALQEEHDLEPGGLVRLEVAAHWRALYWALATWSVGGGVVLGAGVDGEEDEVLLVTDDPDRLRPGPAVLVTRGALARRAAAPVPDGVMDEAAELATFGDDFTAWMEPAGSDPALVTTGRRLDHGSLVAAAGAAHPLSAGARAQLVGPGTEELLLGCLAAWSVGGSVVAHLGSPQPDVVTRRAQDEGVTATLG
ncbi:TIGR03089 family protein [Janibacter alkaliphilus]|uniref:Uncharacterized protein (TIGR03089 family) n=1 Tax=Janibacter alkaliphilus TaxID=1069963 RepID=A0A852X4D4_9MICO|nr:TIGR03089 family protein [Janibacter alkaliphilus]NYG35633.1 uncharacterized protein (TIGR03089 family) [Janibacter alkaliphilus]